MTLLLVGLALFYIAHFAKTLQWSWRDYALTRFGAILWRLISSATLIGSVVLMVIGYGTASTAELWQVPSWAHGVTLVLMLPVLVIYMGSYSGSAVRSFVRHPQLTGFSFWAVLHIAVNGQTRALILFGGLLIWAILTMRFLNIRDGEPPLTDRHPSMLRAWASIPIGIVAWGVIVWVHSKALGVNMVAWI